MKKALIVAGIFLAGSVAQAQQQAAEPGADVVIEAPAGGGVSAEASGNVQVTEPGTRIQARRLTITTNGNQASEKVAYLGVATMQLMPPARKQLGLRVVQVEPNSPAAQAGLRVQDILLRVNEQKMFNELQLRSLIQSFEPGDTVTLNVVRGDKPEAIKVKLGETTLSNDVVFTRVPGAALMPALPGRLNQPLPGIATIRVDGTRTAVTSAVETGADGTRMELNSNNDQKHLKITGRDGKVIYDGPFNTDKEKAAVPEAFRKRAEGLLGGATGQLHLEALAPGGQEHAFVITRNLPPGGQPPMIWVDRQNQQRIDWSDGDVDLTLTIKHDGQEALTHLLIKDDTGKVLYDGPFDTADQRGDVPRNLQEKVMLALLKNFKDTGGALQPVRIRVNRIQGGPDDINTAPVPPVAPEPPAPRR